jgi:imidazole glycerol-phosphate synthase subunit HisH
MITIIDYKIGNLGSIKNMLKRIGVESLITSNIEDIENAEKLILPGVGHFDYGMKNLHQSGLVEILSQRVLQNKVPILGICLGVQLLTESSDEGIEKGLGWIKGKTIAFDKTQFTENQKIPHMGWGEIENYASSRLFENMYQDPRYYFVHSYHLALKEKKEELCTMHYGYGFCAGIEKDNILGVQFHPEKSHKFGMRLLENFIKNY